MNNREYDVLPGGKEFVLVVRAGRPEKRAPPPLPRITTVLNWTEELKRRAPTRAQ